MTNKEFEKKMREIAKIADTEEAHIKADDLMAQALQEAGYEKGVKVFEQITKQYA